MENNRRVAPGFSYGNIGHVHRIYQVIEMNGNASENALEVKMTIKEVSEQYNISADTLRYYERIGMIPPVTRTAKGIRDYQEEDLGWVELAICMRNAGLSVDAIAEYVGLCQQGDSTVRERLELLTGQREILLRQKEQIEEMLARLNYKVERYEQAVRTGVLSWDEECSKNGKEEQEG